MRQEGLWGELLPFPGAPKTSKWPWFCSGCMILTGPFEDRTLLFQVHSKLGSPLEKATGPWSMDSSGGSDFLPFHLPSFLPSTSANNSQQEKWEDVYWVIYSSLTSLKSRTSLWAQQLQWGLWGWSLLWETRPRWVPPPQQAWSLGCQRHPHSSPHRGKATEDRHKTRHTRPSVDTSQDVEFRGRRKAGTQPTWRMSQILEGFSWGWHENTDITHLGVSSFYLQKNLPADGSKPGILCPSEPTGLPYPHPPPPAKCWWFYKWGKG